MKTYTYQEELVDAIRKSYFISDEERQEQVDIIVDKIINNPSAVMYIDRQLINRCEWRFTPELNDLIVGKELAKLVNGISFTTHDEDMMTYIPESANPEDITLVTIENFKDEMSRVLAEEVSSKYNVFSQPIKATIKGHDIEFEGLDTDGNPIYDRITWDEVVNASEPYESVDELIEYMFAYWFDGFAKPFNLDDVDEVEKVIRIQYGLVL